MIVFNEDGCIRCAAIIVGKMKPSKSVALRVYS